MIQNHLTSQRKTAKFKGDCWLWPYSINAQGYGTVKYGEKFYDAHKLLFEIIRVRVPNKLELDHLCRNRSCVNPEHLELVSHAENCRRGKNAKLTKSDVAKIRALSGEKTQSKIAEMFGVTRPTIGDILKGKTWKDT